MKLFTSIIFAASFLFLNSNLEAKTKFTFNSKDGLKLYGEYYAASQPTSLVLVLHGMQSHAGWYTLGDYFADNGISSVIYDRRGSGLSEGMRGHAESADDFINDLDSAMGVLQYYNKQNLPIHIMANSLGAVVAINYLSQYNINIASLILTTPGTHSNSAAEYSFFVKGLILVSPSKDYFNTPLKDEQFVENGPFLEWIKNDTLGNKKFTAGFLRAANNMRSSIGKKASSLKTPLFLLLANEDEVVDNRAIQKEIYAPYKGEKKMKTYTSKHYLFFGRERDLVKKDLKNWILSRQ